MRAARQLGSGLFYALISIVLVLGGLSLALAENKIAPPPAATPSFTPPPLTSTPLPPTQAALTQANVPATQASAPTTQPIAPSATPNILFPTLAPPLNNNCVPPSGWMHITVQSGDSLAGIAARYRLSVEQLMQANCLSVQSVPPGYGIYVPPLPANTAIPCGPITGWIKGYVVQPGDTLFHIATLYRTTVKDLQRANCKGNSTVIFTGDRLWVPNVPTITPGFTLIPTFTTPTEYPTEPLTLTPLPFTATLPTSTSPPEQTATP